LSRRRRAPVRTVCEVKSNTTFSLIAWRTIGAGGFVGSAICARFAAGKVAVLALTRNELDLLKPEAAAPLQRLLKADDGGVDDTFRLVVNEAHTSLTGAARLGSGSIENASHGK